MDIGYTYIKCAMLFNFLKSKLLNILSFIVCNDSKIKVITNVKLKIASC